MSKEIKVITVGDASVGKTSLLHRIVNDYPMENQDPTVGTDVSHLVLEDYKVSLWDTAGQEKFRSLVKLYIRGCHIALLVYDVSSKSSFDSMEHWVEFVLADLSEEQIIFISNKCDLPPENHAVQTEHEINLARKYNTTIIRSSAIDGRGVDEIKKTIVSKMNMNMINPPKPKPLPDLNKKVEEEKCCK